MKKESRIPAGPYPGLSGESSSNRRSLAEHVSWDGLERRRHDRLKVNWKGVLTGNRSNLSHAVDVQVLNVSEGGCCIHVRQPASDSGSLSVLGTEERLSLNLYVPGAVLNPVVEVRWYAPIHEEVYGAGLEFVAMSSRDRSILQSVLKGGSR